MAFNIEKKVAIIGGTFYGGEMKKGIFSMMNYWCVAWLAVGVVGRVHTDVCVKKK